MHKLMKTLMMAAVLIMLASCLDDNRVYDHYEHISIEGWEHNDTLHFAIPPQREGTYNLCIGLRTTPAYPYQDICMVMESTINRTKTRKEKLKCHLMSPDGRIKGKNGVSSNEHLFFISIQHLHDNDSLHITLHHQMQDDMLQGITEVGIQLKKT